MALDALLGKVEMEDDVGFLRDGVRVLRQSLMKLEVGQQHAERIPVRVVQTRRAAFDELRPDLLFNSLVDTEGMTGG